MNIFALGIGIDGEPEIPINLQTSIGILSMIICGIYIILAILMNIVVGFNYLGISANAYRFIQSINILLLVFYIVITIRFLLPCPILIWIYKILGYARMYTTILGQLRVLQIFAKQSAVITRSRIQRFRIIFTLMLLACSLGSISKIFSLGKPFPVIDKWTV